MNANSEKTAVVTGASSGIGHASAEALARAGFTVFGTSRRPVGNGPDGVTMLVCDVTDGASVGALVSTVLAQTGRIDLLVNNAGVGLLGGAEESSVAQVQALFDVNLFGVIRMINAVLPSMRQRGEGRIINIGSILGLVPAPYSAHYSAVKHALEGYSELLDHEVRAFDIRVSVIEPAFVRTVFDQNGIEPDSVLQRIRSGARRVEGAAGRCDAQSRSAGSGGGCGGQGGDRCPPAASLYRRQGSAPGQHSAPLCPRRDV